MALRVPMMRAVGSAVPRVRRAPNALAALSSPQRCFSAPTEDPPEKIVALCDELCTLNVIEMNQLVTLFKDKVGLSGVDVMPQMMMGGGMPMGAMPGAPAAADAVVEEAPKEKEFYDLKLVSFEPTQKIKVIKEVRAITGLGLKEAKDLVEGAPKDLKKEVAKKDAEELIEKLKAVGAEVTMA